MLIPLSIEIGWCGRVIMRLETALWDASGESCGPPKPCWEKTVRNESLAVAMFLRLILNENPKKTTNENWLQLRLYLDGPLLSTLI
jgi:hypothetical protein